MKMPAKFSRETMRAISAANRITVKAEDIEPIEEKPTMTTEKLREALEPFAQLSFEDGMMRGLDPEQFQAAVENAQKALGATAQNGDESYYGEGAFRRDLERAINRHCMENGSDTPDFVLADYLCGCLSVFAEAVRHRDHLAAPEPGNRS